MSDDDALGDEVSGLFFEDLKLGQIAERTWTVSSAVIAAFAEVSGDTNPVHLDDAFAEGTSFKGRIAHGMLAASYISAVIGTQLPGPGSIYLSQSLRFKRPVRPGDEVTAQVTIEALDSERGQVSLTTTCLVRGKAVVEGEALIMVPKKPSDQAG